MFQIMNSLRRYFFRKNNTALRSVKEDYVKRFKMNLSRWLIYHQQNIVFQKCRWMGMTAYKNPFDLWIYQEIIYEIKPDFIVEIGSAHGGSTLYFANILDLMSKGSVISIDIDRTKYKAKHSRIIEITGDSSSPETIRQVAALCDGKIVLIVHDADHTKKQVLKDLNSYAGLVSLNSYFIVEDGIIDVFDPGDGLGSAEEGPLAASEEFLKTHPNFVVDKDRERYILTYNPKGYLKRVR